MPSIKVKTKSCASESGPLGTDTVGEEADAQSCFRGGFVPTNVTTLNTPPHWPEI